MTIVQYLLGFITFWCKDVPVTLLKNSRQVNGYLLNLFSIPLLLKTFFHPLKNEYREGLVLFSRVAGIVVKSVLLAITGAIMIVVLILEAAITITVTVLPLILFYILILS